jgi:pimeloyl-ACP methyl ester carboxylesterase
MRAGRKRCKLETGPTAENAEGAMRLHTRFLVGFGIAVGLGLAACNLGGSDEIDERVDLGTHSLHIRCTGQGRPVVVIDTGLGDTSERWQDMQLQVAEHARVCTYDRAGYGASDPGPMPRTSERAADELRQLLQAAGIRGPYLLVGHSLGGMNAQVFARRYPDQVAGLVLLDPPPLPFVAGEVFPDLHRLARQQTIELKQAAQVLRQSKDPGERAQASFLETLASENEALFGGEAAQIVGNESFGDLPLVVVGSGQPNPGFGEAAHAFQRYWIEQNEALATRSTRGTFILAAESSHHLQIDAPDVVRDAILQVIQHAAPSQALSF